MQTFTHNVNSAHMQQNGKFRVTLNPLSCAAVCAHYFCRPHHSPPTTGYSNTGPPVLVVSLQYKETCTLWILKFIPSECAGRTDLQVMCVDILSLSLRCKNRTEVASNFKSSFVYCVLQYTLIIFVVCTYQPTHSKLSTECIHSCPFIYYCDIDI